MSRKTATKTATQPELIVDNGKADVPAVQKGGQQVAHVVTGPDALFAVIERASRDNSIDLDRMQKLIDMHKEMKADNARAEYDAAMADAQSEMKTIKTNKSNSQTHSKYATYEAMDKAIRPIYTKHGFAVTFNTGDAPKTDDVRVLCTVSHRAGHRENYKLDVPADGKGAKGGEVMTRTHAAGSAISYGKRYLSSMVWNLSVGDDDDGNEASSIAERAKTMADNGITHLNSMSPPTKEALAKWDAENAKAIAFLKKNAPDEFARYQTAYSNAAEAAGIKREEPKRGDNRNQSSTDAAPNGELKKDGQPATSSLAGAGGNSKSEAASKPLPTDVEDLNEGHEEVEDPDLWPERAKSGEKLEFARFSKVVDFCEFAEIFLPRTNKLGAEQFAEWYDGTLVAMERGKKGSQDAAAEIRAQLKKLIQIEPGAEG